MLCSHCSPSQDDHTPLQVKVREMDTSGMVAFLIRAAFRHSDQEKLSAVPYSKDCHFLSQDDR